MKVFEVKDNNKLFGYLYYFEKSDTYYIEIAEGINEWEAHLFLMHSLKRIKPPLIHTGQKNG